MKILVGLVCLFALSTSYANPNEMLLSFEDFKTLNVSDRADYLDTLRKAAVDSEAKAGTRNLKSALSTALLPSAFAAEGDSCIYAGYISKRNARNVCEAPTGLSEKTWNITINGQTKSSQLCTGSGQVLCNPVLFGFGPNGSGFCTTERSYPTADCEKKYQAAPNYKARHVADQLVASGTSEEFNSYRSQLSSYCASAQGSSQSAICKTVSRKSDYMRAKIQASKLRSGSPVKTEEPVEMVEPTVINEEPSKPEPQKTLDSNDAAPPKPQPRARDERPAQVPPQVEEPKAAPKGPRLQQPKAPQPKAQSPKEVPPAPVKKQAPAKETRGNNGNPFHSNDRDMAALRKKGVITEEFGKEVEFAVEKWKDAKGREWKIRTLKSKNHASEPVIFLPHDNEAMALETAVRYIKENGKGSIVFLDCGDKRECEFGGKEVDPNREFCEKSFASKFFSYFPDGQPVITLHTNEDGCRHNGGTGHVSAAYPFSGIGSMRSGDEDDLVVHNGSVPPRGANAQLRSFLEQKNLNEIYENKDSKNDCSMSFEATKRGRFYFNVESEERNTPRGYTYQLNTLKTILSSGIGQRGGSANQSPSETIN